MSENHLVIKAIRRDFSLAHYAIRAEKDKCLHDDVEDFLAKTGSGLDALVSKLINNEFSAKRYSDPKYPQ